MFFKNLQMELTAKKMWEFTDAVKQSIWKEDEYDEVRRQSYRNNETYPDGRPIKYGWELYAEPFIKAFENAQKEHTFDYLDTHYIQIKIAYNFWKQYEHEWNLKYKDYIK